jgi:hypothetical protein
MVELYLHYPIYLHGIVLNGLSRGTTFSDLILLNIFTVLCKGILPVGKDVKKCGVNVLPLSLLFYYVLVFRNNKGP